VWGLAPHTSGSPHAWRGVREWALHHTTGTAHSHDRGLPYSCDWEPFAR